MTMKLPEGATMPGMNVKINGDKLYLNGAQLFREGVLPATATNR